MIAVIFRYYLFVEGEEKIGETLNHAYRISSNKRWVSNKHRPLISAAHLDIHIEISASL